MGCVRGPCPTPSADPCHRAHVASSTLASNISCGTRPDACRSGCAFSACLIAFAFPKSALVSRSEWARNITCGIHCIGAKHGRDDERGESRRDGTQEGGAEAGASFTALLHST